MNIIVDEPYENVNGIKNIVVSQKFAEMLKKGRRYFGSAGASLTAHVNDPEYNSEFKKQVVQTGLSGERSTSEILRKWIAKIPNAVLIDSAHIKGMGKETIDEDSGTIDGGDTDHILIIGNNVILIDTKRWKSGWWYAFDDKGKIIRGKKSFAGGRNVHAKQAKFLWKKYLHNSAKVSSIVVINAKNVHVKRNANWKKQSFRLTVIQDLIKDLEYRYEKFDDYDKTHINSTLVSQIAVCCVKPYDAYDKVFDKNQLKNFK